MMNLEVFYVLDWAIGLLSACHDGSTGRRYWKSLTVANSRGKHRIHSSVHQCVNLSQNLMMDLDFIQQVLLVFNHPWSEVRLYRKSKSRD